MPADKSKKSAPHKSRKDKQPSSTQSPVSATTTSGTPSAPAVSSNSKNPKCELPADTLWHEHLRELKGRNAVTSSGARPPPGTLVKQFRELADVEYKKDLELYNAQNPKDSFLERAASSRSGATLTDRISSMVLLVSTQPLYRLPTFDALLNLASTESRVASLVANAVVDMVTEKLLPKDRSLIDMSERPLLNYTGPNATPLSPKLLILWRFEELLRVRFQSFINLLRSWLAAPLPLTKKVALTTCVTLLISCPEEESTLLTLIVNKLGDPDPKTAAAAAHNLRRVLQTHPAMSSTIAREVQQLSYRPNLNSQSVYNCVTFLNQLQFTRGDHELPVTLCDTYFRLFEYATMRDGKKECKKGKSSKTSKDSTTKADAALKSKLLSALLTGVNRAHPYLPANHLDDSEHVDSLYRISHNDNASLSVQALQLLFNLLPDEKEGKGSDRFFRALYSLLLNPACYNGSGVTLFFNLLFKAIKADPNASRATAIVKRLVGSVLSSTGGNVPAGALYLVAAVGKEQGLVELLRERVVSVGEEEYDMSARDPLYAVSGEEKEGRVNVWEVAMLGHHWHPSVSKFAENLMEDGRIEYKGDPLKDFTLAPFLDRFAYRNPKSKDKLKAEFQLGESIGERKSGGRGLAVAGGVAVNDPMFLQSRTQVGEEFFYKFFAEKQRAEGTSGKKGKEVDIEDAEVDAFGDVDVDWEEDDEEEAFAQQLAEKMMEKDGNGKANYDEEDVDFSMSDNSDDDEEEEVMGLEGEEDIFEEEEGSPLASEDEEEEEVGGGSDSDDDDDDDVPFVDSESEEDEPKKNKKKGKRGADEDKPTFASADDFQVDDFWSKRDAEIEAKEEKEKAAEEEEGGKKKRRKTRRKSEKR